MEKTALNTYKERLKASSDSMEDQFERALDNYRHYLARLDVGGADPNEYPFSSQIVVPFSYELVETQLPRVIGRHPQFTATALEEDDVPYEETAKFAVSWAYENPKLAIRGEPLHLKLNRMCKENLIAGWATGRTFWRRETKKTVKYLANISETGQENISMKEARQMMDLFEENGRKATVKFSKKFVDSPYMDDFDMTHVPFFHFFPDTPMVENGRMRFEIERELMTMEQLEDEAKLFGYDEAKMTAVKSLADGESVNFTPDIDKNFYKEYNEMFYNIPEESFSSDDDKMPLLIVDKMWVSDKVMVFVNEKINLTGEEGVDNPYDVKVNPFIHSHDVTVPHSSTSMSDIDWIKRLEDGATDTLNMRFDNLLQSMLNYWLYNPNMMANGDTFLPIPNSMTAVKDTEKSVRVINGADVTPNAYKEVDALLGMANRATGMQDFAQGVEGGQVAGRTYGGMRLVQEMANARFIVKARMFEEVTLKALGYFALEYSKQFYVKDRVHRLAGSDGQTAENKISAMDLKSIKGMFDIKVVPDSARQLDQQAEVIRINSVADRFSSAKGPFKDIPNEVYDKFLLKYLQTHNVPDAVFWIKSIREAREKKTETPPAPPPASPLAAPLPTLPGLEVPQGSELAPQPNVDSQLDNALQLPGVGEF